MFNKKIIYIIAIVIIISSFSYADNYNDLVRVGLTREQKNTIVVSFDGPHYIGQAETLGEATYYVPVANTYTMSYSAGEFFIEDAITQKAIDEGQNFSNSATKENVVAEDIDDAENSIQSNKYELATNEIILTTGDVVSFKLKDTTMFVSDGTVMTINGTEYSTGFMMGQDASNNLIPVNIVERQTYLKGVVPKEMPASWHIEALKAQAVAARTYSVDQMHRHEDDGYDICDSTHCQVYGGMSSQYSSSSLAVDETAGEILTYNDKPITAYFHSSSGGYIENSEDVFYSPLDYIRAAYDPFSESHEGVNWSKTYSKDELTTLFNTKGYDLGTVIDVTIEKKLKSGRVKLLKIWGSNNILELEANDIRKTFGYTDLKSTLFTIDSESVYNVKSSDNQQQFDSNDLYVINGDGEVVKTDGQVYVKQDFGQKPLISSSADITFNGKGSGHGLGMSQYGASTMANQGAKYEDILSFYYHNAKLKKQ